MHKCWSVKWSLDNNYVLSGSEDACVRVWKAHASAPIRPTHPNEARKLEYFGALKKRYGHFSEINRIDKQRHVPKYIRTAHRVKRQVITNQKKKQHRLDQFNPALGARNAPKPMKEAKVVAVKE